MKNYKNGRVGTIEVAKRVGISPERLRYWEKLGVIKPQYIICGQRIFRAYSQEDIHRATLIKTFIDTEKYTLKEALKKLQEEER